MRINLSSTRRLYAEVGPYKALTEGDLQLLVDGVTSGTSIAVAAESLAVTCVFGARYSLSELVYYRDAATTETVTFFGKQGDQGYTWEEILDTQVSSDKITIDFTQVIGHFEQIKIVHTVTTGTSQVYEVELWADGTQVLFGSLGQETVFSVDAGTDTLLPEPIKVYNPASVLADFYCVVDHNTSNPEGTTLGLGPSGPFYGVYSTGISVPSQFSWASGVLSNVTESAGTLTLTSGTYGYYITPVIDLDTVEGRRLFWQATVTGTASIDDLSRDDSVPTIGVRFSDSPPTDVGWVSGELSIDSIWSVVSGTLPFVPYDNDHILRTSYLRYFQAKVDLLAVTDGDTPILEKVGVEQGHKLTIGPQAYQSIYAQSNYSNHVVGRTSGVLVWSPEFRNIGQ